jgi:hypothetical protein
MARRKKANTANVITDPSRVLAFLIGFPDARVLGADEVGDGLVVSVETGDDEVRCSSCATPAVIEGRTIVVQRPPGLAFGRPMELSWQLRRWCCPAPDCATGAWTEEVPSVRGERPEQ